jgi:hypothetical protein
MVNLNAALERNFLQAPGAEGIGEVPADTKQDGVLFKAGAFEGNHGGRSRFRTY